MKFLTSLVVTMLFSITAMADIAFKNGDKVAFLGDSITYLGAVYPSGYCRLVEKALEWKGIKCDMVYAGISGHKSNQMLERLDRDVLAHKPQWMFLSCGVNDVWHGENGVPLPQYKENITKLVEKAQAAGVNVIILASTLIGEDLNGDNNRKLNEYNDFLHCDTACDEYTHHKNQFIEELLISCMLNNSPALRQAYNKGLIDVQVIIESNTNWKYVLNVTDKYLENEGAVVVKPFDSVRSISNPMLLNPNLFNAYILFCMLTGKPVALFPEVAVRSGYIGDKKPDKVAD